jgi:hypothetical protein
MLVYYCFGVTLQKDETLADGGASCCHRSAHYYISLVSSIVRLECKKGSIRWYVNLQLLVRFYYTWLPRCSFLSQAFFSTHPSTSILPTTHQTR